MIGGQEDMNMGIGVPKQKIWRSKEYLAHVRTRPCPVFGIARPRDAHHVETGGKALKGSDAMTIPSAREVHMVMEGSDRGGHKRAEELYNFSVLETLIDTMRSWIDEHTDDDSAEVIVELLHKHITKTECRIPKALRRSFEKNSGM